MSLPADLQDGSHLLCILSGYNELWYKGGVARTEIEFTSGGTTPPPAFIRGDANQDLTVNISDAVSILSFLFSGGDMNCLDSADTNDDGSVNIADAVYALSYLFSNGPNPEAPFPDCGADPTEDTNAECVFEGC